MKEKSNQAQAAALIRKELKKEFPQTKFRVTSSGFSGGDSVSIHWQNGATTKQVQDITNKYQYGHFDGMTDSYEYSNNRKDIPQTKYVMEQRTITMDIVNQAFEYIRHSWDCLKNKTVDDSSQEIFKQLGAWTAQSFLYRQLSQIDLSNGLTKEMLDKVIFG